MDPAAPRPLLCALALSLAGSLVGPVVAQEHPSVSSTLPPLRESRSGIPFAQMRAFPGGEDGEFLMGVGLYTKTIFSVKIYALGLYVEPEPAARELSSFLGETPRSLSRNPDFYQRLLDGKYAKSLRWILCRTVGGDDVAEAFDDVLNPRLARLARSSTPEESARAQAALRRFRDFFSDELVEGEEVLYSWRPGGRLYTVIGGRELPVLESESLCKALFACFLDEDPISSKAKRQFAERLPLLYRHLREQTPAPGR